MERIEKLTDIYIEHMEQINGSIIEKNTLKNCLIDILDSMEKGRGSNSSPLRGTSPVKSCKTLKDSMSVDSKFSPVNPTNGQKCIKGKHVNKS